MSNRDDLQSQHKLIRDEFKKQASGWSKRRDNLAPVAAQLNLERYHSVLDVASGSGLLSTAIAPHVRTVIATDITPEMLQQAQAKAVAQKIGNINVVLAAAERLPYPDNTFDRVVTRYSLHHMIEPQLVVEEMYRVCQVGGRVAVIDIISPEEKGIANRYNHLERLRDPSHTVALSLDALKTLFTNTGFGDINVSVNHQGEMSLEGWLSLTQPNENARQEILAMLEDDLQGKIRTGFNPYYEGEALKIVHSVATITGTK